MPRLAARDSLASRANQAPTFFSAPPLGSRDSCTDQRRRVLPPFPLKSDRAQICSDSGLPSRVRRPIRPRHQHLSPSAVVVCKGLGQAKLPLLYQHFVNSSKEGKRVANPSCLFSKSFPKNNLTRRKKLAGFLLTCSPYGASPSVFPTSAPLKARGSSHVLCQDPFSNL